MRWWIVGVGAAGLAGCTGRSAISPPGGDAGESGGPIATDTGRIDDGASTVPTPVEGDDAPMPEDTSDDGGDVGFVPPGADHGDDFPCDLFAQDCPPGEKCMPWASDGGPRWNATTCSPIARDPAGYQEMCELRGTSGIDDCDGGMMCWDSDGDGVRRCVHLCTGSAGSPMCPERDEICLISGGVIPVCIETCDPLGDDCAIEGETCYPNNDQWLCYADASGDAGVFGDPCDYINACDPMHVCVGAKALPACEDSIGCCTQLCDITVDTADATCAALEPGLVCEDWYLEGTAPPGYEHVGVCVLPQ